MRKTGLEPAQVALLDPKSKTWPLNNSGVRPRGDEQAVVGPRTPSSATQTATRFPGDVWCWE